MMADREPDRRALLTAALALSASAASGPATAQTAGQAAPGRAVALEEHFRFPALTSRIPSDRVRQRGFPSSGDTLPGREDVARALADLGAARIADMDAAGISLQVLSWNGPGAELLPGEDGIRWSREVNQGLAATIVSYPGRYAGFAHLPMAVPEAAADELARCVGELGLVGAMVDGTVGGLFLDHPSFEPLLARAERLDVPIYLHPSVPPLAVVEAYYRGLPDGLDYRLSTGAYGWHAEVGIHVLRLIFAGALDRHPGLKLIIGHAGEFLPMTLERTTILVRREMTRRSSRTVAEQLRAQVWVTTSGQFSLPVLKVALETFGIDRVLFSVDYPFSSNAQGRAFLNTLELPPADLAKFAHGNADKLLKLVA